MISDSLRSKITSYYDIEYIDEISKLEGGYWNQTFKLETSQGEYVVRIGRPHTSSESIIYQHKLMLFMHTKIPQVPMPIMGKTGETFFVFEDRIVTLLTFLQGETASRKNQKHQIRAAEMLARLHRVGLEYPEPFLPSEIAPLADFNWEKNNKWSWAEIQHLLQNGAEGLQKSLMLPIGDTAFACVKEIASRQLQLKDELIKDCKTMLFKTLSIVVYNISTYQLL